MVRIKNITKVYSEKSGPVTAFSRMSFDVKPNEFVSLIGPSGCGKTTILNIIAGLDTEFEGKRIVGDTRISFMFQETALLPWRTVEGNLNLPFEISPPQVKTNPGLLLQKIDLPSGDGDKLPHQLSGGQKRRVYLAQSLINDPSLLLLDEPLTGLDYDTKTAMRNLIADYTNKTTIIMATHDIEDAILLSDRILILSRKPAEIIKDIDVKSIRQRDDSFFKTEKKIYDIFDSIKSSNPTLTP